MKKNFTLLIAALTLLTFLISPMAMRGQSDYSTDYTGNITLSTTGGSNASDCLVVIGDAQYAGIKAGTSSKTGSVMITVPTGTKYLHLHVAAWNNSTASLAVTPTGYSDNIELTANTGITYNSPFTFDGDPSTGEYYKVITFSDAMAAETELTFTAVGGKRFVVWGVTSEEEGSSTTTPTLVTIDDSHLTNTDIYQGTSAGYLTATVKTNAGTTISGASVTWSSNNTAVATIDNGGHITLVEAGQATITASYAGVADQYGASHANYQLTVTNSDPDIPGSEDNPYTVEQAREAIDNGLGTQSVYATGIVSQIVTPYNSNYGNITFDISDDGETTSDQLRAYRCGGDEAANVLVGDIVTIYGNLTKYGTTYEFDTGCEIVSLEHTQTIYTVTYNPNITGTAPVVETYVDGTSVTIASNHFSNPGHAFSSWNTNANGQGVTYLPGATYVIHSNLVLYAQWIESSDNVDVLNWAATGSPTNYTDWTYTGISGAEYAGQSSGNYQSIQLRSNNNNSGIVTTTSAGLVTKVAVIWNTNTYDGRVLNVYGSNTAYTAATDLYSEDTAGDLIGTIVYGTSTELDITDSYEYIGLRSANSALYLDEIDITWNTGGTPSPSISANNVEVAYNATSGAIEYTINNAPTPAGVLTASTGSDWLTIGTVGTTVPFTCSANNDGTSRTATVTLTYTYNSREAVIKNVTVTQAGNPNMTNSISDITEVGTSYTVVGTVVAVNNKGFAIGDGTGYVYTYLNSTPTYEVGDIVKISGTTGSYGHIIQFINSATIEEATVSGYDGTPEVTVISEIPDYSEGYHLSTYLQYQGLLVHQGNDYRIQVGSGNSASDYIQISYPNTAQTTSLMSLQGKTVRVKGYFAGINSNNYFTTMMESIEEIFLPTITLQARVDVPAAESEGTLEVTYQEVDPSAGLTVQWYTIIGTQVEGFDWITISFDSDYNIEYHVDASFETAARTACFMIVGQDAESNTIRSNRVDVVQAKYIEPIEPVTYTLATTIESGKQYIIVGSKTINDETSYYALGEQKTNNRAGAAITVDGNTATVEFADVYEVVITALEEEGFYSIYDARTLGYLYAASSSGNQLKTETELDVNGEWAISIDEEGQFSVVAANSENRNVMQFNYNSGNPLFNCYSDATQSPVSLYVREESSMTQTLALAEGWNWCSFNVETTLNDLKAALVAALPGTVIIIKQKNGTTSYDPQRNRWIGNITWDLANMYEIKITSSCNITLEGTPINTAELPITIKNGNNWIAFPVSESMSLTNAFANIAVNGDVIKSKDGSAIYNRGRWQGSTLTTLEPGQGYLYKSSVSNDRTLIY